MPRFKILSCDGTYRSAEIVADDAGGILHVVGQLDCSEADVLQDDRYIFSVLVDRNGVWCVFQRKHDLARQPISQFG